MNLEIKMKKGFYVKLESDVIKSLKIEAANRGVKMSEILTELITKYLRVK